MAIYKDETEKIIRKSFGHGKTGDRAIEKHREQRHQTERSIGWDGSTTREQRDRMKRK